MATLSLAERLMKVDRGDMTAAKKMEVKAPTLSEKLGEEVKITLHSLPGATYAEFGRMAQNKRGDVDPSRSYDAQAMMIAEAIEGIDVKDPELQRHFGAETPKDLVKILFPGGELVKMANVVGYISGFLSAEDADLDDEDLGLDYKSVKN